MNVKVTAMLPPTINAMANQEQREDADEQAMHGRQAGAQVSV